MRFCLIYIFILGLFNLQSQIVFNGSNSKSAAGVSSLTYSKTVSAGNNRLLYVGVGVEGQNTAISGVTWNGRALTLFTVSNVTSASSRGAMYYIALGSSASPTTANVVVTLGTGKDVSSGAADYSGVWQAAPFVNPTISNGNNTSPTITFGSSVGNKAVALLSSTAGSATANGAGQTEYWSIGGAFPCASTEKPGAVSVTMTHTIASSNKWIMIGGTMQDHAVMLPIELTKFEAVCNYTNYALHWETASEKESDFFEIERRTNNGDWQTVSKVKAHGFSNSTINYNYIDEFESYSPVYYRLTQFDKDGSFSRSQVINPYCNENLLKEIILFPNPLNNVLNINFEFIELLGPYELKIYNSRGKSCFETVFDSDEKKFNKSFDLNLLSGLYLVVINDSYGHTLTKQRIFVN